MRETVTTLLNNLVTVSFIYLDKNKWPNLLIIRKNYPIILVTNS